LHAFATTYFLTLTNPLTILSFIAIFAGLVLGNINYFSATLLVFGIIIGSAMWWSILSGSVSFILKHRMTKTTMRMINALSGIIILAFGAFILKDVLLPFLRYL
jgi:threonine/homoserine/homoserine lactone efflux protein